MSIGFLTVRPLTGDAHGGKATRQRRARGEARAEEDAGGLPQIGSAGEEVGEMGRSGNYPQISGHQPEERLLISKLV